MHAMWYTYIPHFKKHFLSSTMDRKLVWIYNPSFEINYVDNWVILDNSERVDIQDKTKLFHVLYLLYKLMTENSNYSVLQKLSNLSQSNNMKISLKRKKRKKENFWHNPKLFISKLVYNNWMGLWGLGKEKHKSHTVPSCGVPDIISIIKSLSAQDVIKKCYLCVFCSSCSSWTCNNAKPLLSFFQFFIIFGLYRKKVTHWNVGQ